MSIQFGEAIARRRKEDESMEKLGIIDELR